MATTQEEDALEMMLDELWDLQEALQELEVRREKLRAAVLQICQRRGTTVEKMLRGTLKVDRYLSYVVPQPSAIIDVLRTLRWEDDVLQVRGRALYKAAQARLDTRAYFDAALATKQHEVLVLTPRRR